MTATRDVERLIVGGGLFGCYAAIVLANRGYKVLLAEQDAELLSRASYINQARIHTGLHYPRSILTAMESLTHYQAFRRKWPSAVRDFMQIYAVATHNSKTSGEDFAEFIQRLQIPAQELDPDIWFYTNTVSRAFQVEEPAFDAEIMRNLLSKELANHPNISLLLGTSVVRGEIKGNSVRVTFNSGSKIEADGLVLAMYAGTNSLRVSLGLNPLPLRFELAEVILGNVEPRLQGYGFTVMDGPFWSLMPFGHGSQVSLTSVGMTPLRTALGSPRFACQSERTDCTPERIQDCTACPVRPISVTEHHQQQMSAFLRNSSAFTPTRSLLTVKATLTSTDVDDARPTIVLCEANNKVTTIFSGKISTLLDLDRSLQ
jgi:hypothetical protein